MSQQLLRLRAYDYVEIAKSQGAGVIEARIPQVVRVRKRRCGEM